MISVIVPVYNTEFYTVSGIRLREDKTCGGSSMLLKIRSGAVSNNVFDKESSVAIKGIAILLMIIGSSALMMGRFLFTLTQEHRNHKVLALRSPFHEKAAPGAQPSLL